MQRYTHIELNDKAETVSSLPDIMSTETESAQKTGTYDCDTEITEVTPEVTNPRQKLRKTDKNWQDDKAVDSHPKLIKPHSCVR